MKSLFTLILTLSFTILYSTTHLVKEYGVNGTFSTIQSAIDAASDGDTVMVYPKPSGIAWQENPLNIRKDIILAQADGNKFDINQGGIRLYPTDGQKFRLNNYDLGNYDVNVNNDASTSDRCIITVIGSSFGSIYCDYGGVNLIVLNSEIQNRVRYKYGLIVGNKLENIELTHYSHGFSDSLIIAGNIQCDIEITTDHYVWIYNNYVVEREGEDAIGINKWNNGSKTNIIANNTIHYAAARGIYVSTHRNNKIVNNYLHCHGSYCTAISRNTSHSTSNFPFVSYNYSNQNSSNTIEGINVGLEQNFMDINTSGLGSYDSHGRMPNNNKGNYLGQYYDIDLTRNDVGTTGGPHHIDNFWPSNPNNSKARITFLNLPHFLTTLGQINVKGSAHIKE